MKIFNIKQSFEIRLGHYRLKLPIVATVFVLLVVSLFIRLGYWQMERAAYKIAKQTQFEMQKDRPAQVVIADNIDNIEPFQQIEISGVFNEANAILLDNQVLEMQAGYHVYTPLRLHGSNRAVLINRGWIKASGDRRELPTIPSAPSQTSLVGVAKYPVQPYLLEPMTYQALQWPLVVQALELDALSEVLGYDLAPFTLWPATYQTPGLVPVTANPKLSPNKHYGYAFQWLAMAIALFVIYIGIHLKRNAVKRP